MTHGCLFVKAALSRHSIGKDRHKVGPADEPVGGPMVSPSEPEAKVFGHGIEKGWVFFFTAIPSSGATWDVDVSLTDTHVGDKPREPFELGEVAAVDHGGHGNGNPLTQEGLNTRNRTPE